LLPYRLVVVVALLLAAQTFAGSFTSEVTRPAGLVPPTSRSMLLRVSPMAAADRVREVAMPFSAAVPFAAIIVNAAARHGVDANLVRAVIQVESGFQPQALSTQGAMGLMQLTPETARRYAVQDPYDPEGNIDGGIKHLKSLLARFDLDLSLALAAYNAGEAAVDHFGGMPPYPETRSFVRQVLRLANGEPPI
jgi:soluble lytic murein transglycosylase-like protein